jgi:adenylosuccinate synthase
MGNVTVIGAQWGDEGKGKIVDWLSNQADIVFRFQGGNNAGHTIVIKKKKIALSLIPSGVIRKGTVSVIGNGVVVNPLALLDEIKSLRRHGVNINSKNLILSDCASIIFSFHKNIDKIREERKGVNKIGTTGRGIGPAYEDKIGRRAIRFGDLSDEDILNNKIRNILDYHNIILAGLNSQPLKFETIKKEINSFSKSILKYVKRTAPIIESARLKGKRILFEGAQGVLLDVDHGTYPYVTSSNTVPSSAAVGTGISTKQIGFILGIVKAYTTRVGSGPFPSELDCDVGKKLGEIGNEFGTVTGRQRRCGWFDAVLLKHSINVSGIDGIALTKLDVLDSFKEVKICIGYKLNGKKINHFPQSESDQKNIIPIYETHKGWQEKTKGAKSWSKLPALAIKYVRRIEELLGVQVSLLSTSPKREDTILVKNPFID